MAECYTLNRVHKHTHILIFQTNLCSSRRARIYVLVCAKKCVYTYDNIMFKAIFARYFVWVCAPLLSVLQSNNSYRRRLERAISHAGDHIEWCWLALLLILLKYKLANKYNSQVILSVYRSQGAATGRISTLCRVTIGGHPILARHSQKSVFHPKRETTQFDSVPLCQRIAHISTSAPPFLPIHLVPFWDKISGGTIPFYQLCNTHGKVRTKRTPRENGEAREGEENFRLPRRW